MEINNLVKLQHPRSHHVAHLYQRSSVAQYPSPYDYIKEPLHCCSILICKWREITSNFYKNNHVRRHILMQNHLLELQGLRMKCSTFLDLPEYDHYKTDETVYVHLRAIEHNESFVVEIVSITNDQTVAMPLYDIHASAEELFKPRSSQYGTGIPCCGIMECKKRDMKFGREFITTAGGFQFKLHPLFDLPAEVAEAPSQDRVCLHLKILQQEIKALSAFVCPVGFCHKTKYCSCDACKHMVSTYHFGRKVLSTDVVIPKTSQLYFISKGLNLSCESKNAIFIITCQRCKDYQYVGQTIGSSVRERIRALCYDYRNDKRSRLCNHFRQKDHNGLTDWEITVIDQLPHVKDNLNDLEQLWIDRLETLNKQYGGLNMNPAAGQKTLLFISDNKLINCSAALKFHEITPKRFPGKSIDEIAKMAPIIIEREKPKRIILHVGSLDVATEKPCKQIAKEILQLVYKLQTNSGYVVWISGLLPRDGLKNKKVMAINKILHHYCQEKPQMRFIDHCNIDPSVHFKVDRHLNAYGIQTFASNVDGVFQKKYSDERKERSIDLYKKELIHG
ncbi:uncharacterized protein [Clytia hemisphaerica]|uniref:Uncharacterized protein n=1 Tax=Clytia hemisphaerica TaxID=252671 RepID=A0A7M5V8F5_9CNID|eukprot:TCONS_00008037-protein